MKSPFNHLPPFFRVAYWRGDDIVIEVTKHFSFTSSYGTITVPIGFHSDGLSIPRIAWPLVGPATGKGFAAGLIHDFLYSQASNLRYPDFTRAEADAIFLECLYHLGVSWPKRHAMHLAVRSFGWQFYKKK
jgi:hypothetical protein